MACCVIAAFLIAQCIAMLRRWGVFWGVLPVPAGEVADTAFTRTAAWLRRPQVRLALSAAVAVELMAVGSWVYLEHGEHVARIADAGWAELHGQKIIYAELCGEGAGRQVRLVVASRLSSSTQLN